MTAEMIPKCPFCGYVFDVVAPEGQVYKCAECRQLFNVGESPEEAYAEEDKFKEKLEAIQSERKPPDKAESAVGNGRVYANVANRAAPALSANLLRGCKPLSDPVHLYSRLIKLITSLLVVLFAVLVCYSVFSEISKGRSLNIEGLIVGLIAIAIAVVVGMLPVAGIRLLLKRGAHTVIYLRAFSLDESSRKLFRLLRTALGENCNLCGIRAPRHRTPVWMRFGLFVGLPVALRYIGSERYELEASEDDWMPRLLVSMKQASFAVIDIRNLTVNVERELELALLAFKPEYCIAIVDNSRREDEWRGLLGQLGHAVAAKAGTLRLVPYSEENDASDAQFVEQVKKTVESATTYEPFTWKPLVSGVINDQAIDYVKSITNRNCWRTPFLQSDRGKFVVWLLVVILVCFVPTSFISDRYPWFITAFGYFVCISWLCFYTLAWKRSYSIAKFARRHGRDSKQSGLRRLRRSLTCVVAFLAILAVLQFISFGLARVRMLAYRMICGTNLSGIGKAMLLYANDYEDEFPTANKWCDLLIEKAEVLPKHFKCRGAVEGTCHYAMNKHVIKFGTTAEPGLVLLFEAHDGWNQVGGPELLTTDHHQGEGCNILFVDSHVEFVRSSQIPDLRWE